MTTVRPSYAKESGILVPSEAAARRRIAPKQCLTMKPPSRRNEDSRRGNPASTVDQGAVQPFGVEVGPGLPTPTPSAAETLANAVRPTTPVSWNGAHLPVGTLMHRGCDRALERDAFNRCWQTSSPRTNGGYRAGVRRRVRVARARAV